MQTTAVQYRAFGVFRTILALMVIIQHVGHVGPPGMELGRLATGSIAVLAFFSLSGFVISEAVDTFYAKRPIEFAVNRTLRILPQYLVALVFSMSAVTIGLALDPDFLPNSLVEHSADALFAPTNILVNVFAVVPGVKAAAFVPYAWALKVEILFYAVLAVSIVTTRRYFFLAAVGLAMFGASLAGKGPNAFEFAPFFAFGTASYIATKSRTRSARLLQASLFGLCLWTGLTISIPGFYVGRAPFDMTEKAIHVALLVATLLIPVLLSEVAVSRSLATIDRRIGDLSFPLYLQQYAILVLAYAFLPKSYLTVVVIFVAAVAAAWLSDRMLEAPLRRVRDYIRGRSLVDHRPRATRPLIEREDAGDLAAKRIKASRQQQ